MNTSLVNAGKVYTPEQLDADLMQVEPIMIKRSMKITTLEQAHNTKEYKEATEAYTEVKKATRTFHDFVASVAQTYFYLSDSFGGRWGYHTEIKRYDRPTEGEDLQQKLTLWEENERFYSWWVEGVQELHAIGEGIEKSRQQVIDTQSKLILAMERLKKSVNPTKPYTEMALHFKKKFYPERKAKAKILATEREKRSERTRSQIEATLQFYRASLEAKKAKEAKALTVETSDS